MSQRGSKNDSVASIETMTQSLYRQSTAGTKKKRKKGSHTKLTTALENPSSLMIHNSKESSAAATSATDQVRQPCHCNKCYNRIYIICFWQGVSFPKVR